MKFPLSVFCLLLALSAVGAALGYQPAPMYGIIVGPGDEAYLRDFWAQETDPRDGSYFRWSKDISTLVFHNAGQIFPRDRLVTLELGIAAARPAGSDLTAIHLELNGAPLASFDATSDLKTEAITFDPSQAGGRDWVVSIDSETFRPANDNRDLGIWFQRATLRVNDASPPFIPTFPSALYALLTPPLLFLFVRELNLPPRLRRHTLAFSTVVAIGAVVLIGFGLALRREQTVFYLPALCVLVALLAAVVNARWFARAWASWIPARAAISFARAAFIGSVALLALGALLIGFTRAPLSLGAGLTAGGAAMLLLTAHLHISIVSDPQRIIRSYWPWLFIGLIILLGLMLRVFLLDHVFFGLFRDETRFGLLGLRVLDDPTYRPIFEGPPINQSGLFIYLLALAFKLFGANIFVLRLVGALAGMLVVLLVWILARAWFGDVRAALLAALGVAISEMHVYYSRFAVPYVESTMFSIPAYLFLWRALKHGRGREYALAGFFFAAAQYTSQIGRVSLVVGAFIVLNEIVTRRPRPRHILRGAVVASATGLLVLAPLLFFITQDPRAFFARTEQVYVLNPRFTAGEYPLNILWNNIAKYAGMFNIAGDSHGGRIVPTRPEVDPLFGVLFLIGLVYALTRLHEANYRLVLFWFIAALLPGILTIEAPAPLRVLEVAAPTFMLAGIGGTWLWINVKSWVSQQHVGRALGGIAAALLVLAILANWLFYFDELGNDPRIWEKNQAVSTAVGANLERWRAENLVPPTVTVYLPDSLFDSPDDRDALKFTNSAGVRFASLSKAGGAGRTLAPHVLIVRPNVVGYSHVINARVPQRAQDEHARTGAQITAALGSHAADELRGENFPASNEPTFWLYVVR